ncbi:MAG: GNAT family N-acetyltransferase [Gemmiger sp.]|nr:GNAT family N-acetyltransferase [Gemmiger sp.]
MSGPLRGPAPSMAGARQPSTPPAYAYLLRCEDGSLYAGWTNDLARRMQAHKTGRGAKYTRARHGENLAYAERCETKSAAMRREAALKALTKAEKEALASAWAEQNRVTVRLATPEDAEAVVALYGWYVTHTTATFQYTVPTVAEYRQKIADTLEKAPFLVAYCADGSLRGYACAHLWHEREAYAWDVETTIYCAPEGVGCGVGRRLYTALLAMLKAQGYYNAFALVASPNPASDAFHKAMGFVRFGLEPRTGYKFGQWQGLGYWMLPLQPGTAPPEPVCYRLDEKTVEKILKKANQA